MTVGAAILLVAFPAICLSGGFILEQSRYAPDRTWELAEMDVTSEMSHYPRGSLSQLSGDRRSPSNYVDEFLDPGPGWKQQRSDVCPLADERGQHPASRDIVVPRFRVYQVDGVAADCATSD
jgi:hypothetical protein